MEKENFKQSIIKGLSWSFLNQIVSQLISLGLSIILARLLSPDEFGVMAMIVIFTNFARIFIDFGFSSALVQKKEVSQSNFSTVFWFNIFSGALLTMIFYVGSDQVAAFYDNPILSKVTKVLSFTFLISSITAIQSARLVRELAFKQQALISWSSTIASSLVAIVLAYKGYGVWSLVVQTLVSSLVTSLFYWFFSSWRPSFIFNVADLKEMYKFGGNVAGSAIFNYWTRNMDNLMIGKLLGDGPLGIYNRAYTLMLLPVNNITGSVTRVMFPAFSSIQEDLPRTKAIYLRITRTIAFISFPLMFGLCAVSEPFIYFAYGPRWAGVIPVLQILSILGAFQSVISLNGVIYNSQGRADLALRVTVVLNVILLAAFFVGIKVNGVIGLTWGYFLVAVLGSIPILYLATRLIQVTLEEQARNLAKIFFASLVMLGVVFLLGETAFIAALGRFWQLLVLTTCGMLTYAILVISFKEQVYLESLKTPLFNAMRKVRNKITR